MLIVAHRGFSAALPENTLAAFTAAIAAGADLIETDPRLSRDGVVVCFHDPTLMRRTGRPGTIADTDHAELRAIPLAEGDRIPALEEVLDLARGRVRVALDVKIPGPAMQDRIAAAARRTGMTGDIVQGVRSVEDCRTLAERKSCGEILAFLPGDAEPEAFARAGAGIVRLWEETLNAEALAAVREAGCRAWATCGMRRDGEATGHCTPARVAALAAAGIDGVLLNDPEMARAALAGNRGAR